MTRQPERERLRFGARASVQRDGDDKGGKRDARRVQVARRDGARGEARRDPRAPAAIGLVLQRKSRRAWSASRTGSRAVIAASRQREKCSP